MKIPGLIASLMLTAAPVTAAVAAPALMVHGHVAPVFVRGAAPWQNVHPLPPASHDRATSHVQGQVRVKAPEQYTIIDAPDAGSGSGQGTYAVFVDSLGRATGFYADGDDNYHSYIRTPDGAFTVIDVNGPDNQTIAHWANDKGAVVGDYFDSGTSQYEGFLRKPGGKIVTFDAVQGGSHYTVPVSINVKNETAGYYYGNGYGTDVHAFIRAKDGTLSQFDAPDAGLGSFQGTYTQDINSGGTIVGYYLDANNALHGFLRAAGGTITEFDVPGAGGGSYQGTQGVGIDNKGWISGDYIDSAGVSHGFVRSPGGAITTFDAPDAGAGGTSPIEINRHRAVTGWYLDASTVYHGLLRTKDGSLAEFDAPGAGTGPYFGTSGYDINQDDVIAGWDQDDNGVYHGFLRTP